MNAIPPGLFTLIIVGGFYIAAVIIGIAEGARALQRRKRRNQRYKRYEQSRRQRIRALRRDQFKRDAENMENTYHAAIVCQVDRLLAEVQR